uniref:Elongation factor Ts, mitochondrial n=1 Tax=Rhodochaete parvula TaxID=110510 RepID=A0A1X9PUU3_9RHOD|nr:translation elongation factor Ts [Rhodochaete parvula]ASK39656.1 elongation factor Ts [Rhodochaete parvula]
MSSEISAQIVKKLRDQTGAGMMDCKKALQACKGDITQALEALRLKGLASADKKSSRQAVEGLVDSYIHTGGRIGVLLEVNCETDFVARRVEFHDLVKNIAMQIAASPNVEFISTNDIPEDIINNERRIESLKDDLANKPDEIKNKIVNGRIQKRLKELALLDQLFIKDQNMTIEELIKQSIALLGENIKVSRFQRFILGTSN